MSDFGDFPRHNHPPRKYLATIWHRDGRDQFCVISRYAFEKAVAMAVLHFEKLHPDSVLLDLRLDDMGPADFELDDDGNRWPPEAEVPNEIWDPVEWM